MKRIICIFTTLLSMFYTTCAQIVKEKKETMIGSAAKTGFVDKKGKWVIKPIYDWGQWFNDSKIGEIGDYSISPHARGLIDETGKIIFPIGKYTHYFRSVKNGKPSDYVSVTAIDDKTGLATMKGVFITPIEFRFTFSCDDYILTEKDENGESVMGAYSYEGKEIIPCVFSKFKYKYGLFHVERKGKRWVYNKYGNSVVPKEIYEETVFAGDDLFSVKKNGKWGIWGNNRELIPCQYDDIIEFKNDVATVKQDGEVKLVKNPLKDGSQIQVVENIAIKNKKQRGPVVSRYPKPDSDVDTNIPMAKNPAENTFAFIICNENYPDAPVPYSLNDGRMFREYCQKALGLPEKNINMYEDATFGTIITAVEKMKSVADAYEGEASVIFYYAGHGFPDDKQQSAYLLPIDGDASNITITGYSLAKLYKEIASLKLKSSVVFLDACFSGAKREDQMLASSRGVAIKVKDETPQGKMVVFSAAQGDETAHQLEDKHHGLFTYYLLKELQTTGGDVDMGTLTDYVTKQVKRQSVVINNKKQTPTVIPSQSFANSWQSLKLK